MLINSEALMINLMELIRKFYRLFITGTDLNNEGSKKVHDDVVMKEVACRLQCVPNCFYFLSDFLISS